MADFAEMSELIARCLGYPGGKFTEVYNRILVLQMKKQSMPILLQQQSEFCWVRKQFVLNADASYIQCWYDLKAIEIQKMRMMELSYILNLQV